MHSDRIRHGEWACSRWIGRAFLLLQGNRRLVPEGTFFTRHLENESLGVFTDKRQGKQELAMEEEEAAGGHRGAEGEEGVTRSGADDPQLQGALV